MGGLSTNDGQGTGDTCDLATDTASVIAVMKSMPSYIEADGTKLTQLTEALTQLSTKGTDFAWAGLMAAAVDMQKQLVMGFWSDSQEEFELDNAFYNATLKAYRSAGHMPAIPTQGEVEDPASAASRREKSAVGVKFIKEVCSLPCKIRRREILSGAQGNFDRGSSFVISLGGFE